MYKKTPPPPPNLFSFIEPFSLDVWIYMTTAYLGASLTMFLLARWEKNIVLLYSVVIFSAMFVKKGNIFLKKSK